METEIPLHIQFEKCIHPLVIIGMELNGNSIMEWRKEFIIEILVAFSHC